MQIIFYLRYKIHKSSLQFFPFNSFANSFILPSLNLVIHFLIQNITFSKPYIYKNRLLSIKLYFE